jgi:manganese transport protein
MEIAIASTHLAEVIGSAVALNLLIGIPVWAGVLITPVDTLLILVFGTKSFRFLEDGSQVRHECIPLQQFPHP